MLVYPWLFGCHFHTINPDYYLMKKRSLYCILTLFCCCSFLLTSNAQRSDIWVFGNRAGLDFSSGSPQPFLTKMNSIEASASVAGDAGQLLFYTDGNFVINSHHDTMQNGAYLLPVPSMTNISSPTASSSQGALIVPMPGDTNKYYLLSITSDEYASFTPVSLAGRFYYSIIDMTLDNGKGAVVPGQKGVLIDTNLTEMMVGIAGKCNNVWVLVRSRVAPYDVRAYEITENGISANTVSSNLFAAFPYSVDLVTGGTFAAVAHAKNKVAFGMFAQTVICDFDINTGLLSNLQVLNPNAGGRLCFSPDDTKLYRNLTTTYQYDLSLATPAAILASETMLIPLAPSQLKVGPDGKLYQRGSNATNLGGCYSKLSVIEFPNLPGLAAAPQIDQLLLYSNNQMACFYTGFPGDVPKLQKDTIRNATTVNACQQAVLTASDTTAAAYRWNDGFTAKRRTLSNSGTYWVRYETPCTFVTDTFKVHMQQNSTTQVSKVLCGNQTYAFAGKVLNTTGRYRDTLQSAIGCDSIIVLDLIVLPAQQTEISFQNPPALCLGDSILFQGSGAQYYQWFVNGKLRSLSNPDYLIVNTLSNEIMLVGTSTVTGADVTCRDTVSVSLSANSCCDLYLPTAFSPNGDGINDVLTIKTAHHFPSIMFEIFDRWGKLVFSTNQSGIGWDGTFSGKEAGLGVYYYYLKYTCDDGKQRIKKGDITLLR